MNIGLQEAAAIIGRTPDELMFLHQTGKIQAGVDQETLKWQFDLQTILSLKSKLEAAESLSEGQTEQFLTE